MMEGISSEAAWLTLAALQSLQDLRQNHITIEDNTGLALLANSHFEAFIRPGYVYLLNMQRSKL
jgi:hypothetical protein